MSILRRLLEDGTLHTLGGPGSGNFQHAGRPGEIGGSATQVGITSFGPQHHADKNSRDVDRSMHTFRNQLSALPHVRDVRVVNGVGIFHGQSEPTWVTSYTGNGEAYRLLAETGQKYNQDAVLVIRPGDSDRVVELTFDRTVSVGRRDHVQRELTANGLDGGTWFERSGKDILRMASVSDWGGDKDSHLANSQKLQSRLSSIGIRSSMSVHPVSTEVIGRDRYSTILKGLSDGTRHEQDDRRSAARLGSGRRRASAGQGVDAAAISAAPDEYAERRRDDGRTLGGPGSGNFSHVGRPGAVGGSSDAGLREPDAGIGSRTALPPATNRPTPNAVVQHEADGYSTLHGLTAVDHTAYLPVDESTAKSIAAAYDALPVDDTQNPAVVSAYTALAAEVDQQYAYATANGMHFEPWTRSGQPYETSQQMAADVAKNRHLYFYTGGAPNAFLDTRDASGLSANEKFRAIHDYFGHAAGGFGFGARGEENAWAAHSQMFSDLARRAMTTETRGQNSWVNFGKQNYNADGSPKHIAPADRPYAQQKIALLPETYSAMRHAGSASSGNFGHAGRPGSVGGSSSSDSSGTKRVERDTITAKTAIWSRNFDISDLPPTGTRFMIHPSSTRVLLAGPKYGDVGGGQSHAEMFDAAQKDALGIPGKYDDYLRGWVSGPLRSPSGQILHDPSNAGSIAFYAQRLTGDDATRFDAYVHAVSAFVTGGHATRQTTVYGLDSALGSQFAHAESIGAAFPFLFKRSKSRAAALVTLAHDFASTQVQVPPDIAAMVRAFGRTIPDADLAADGRETDIHITVKYGLSPDVDPSALVAVLPAFPLSAALGRTAYFSSDEFDVVYVVVHSGALEQLNAVISATVPCPGSVHATYTPHCTVAYVRPGLGSQYAERGDMSGHLMQFDSLVFSPADGEKIVMPFGAVDNGIQSIRVVDRAAESRDNSVRHAEAYASSVLDAVEDDLRAAQALLLDARLDASDVDLIRACVGASSSEVREMLAVRSLEPAWRAVHRIADAAHTEMQAATRTAFRRGARSADRTRVITMLQHVDAVNPDVDQLVGSALRATAQNLRAALTPIIARTMAESAQLAWNRIPGSERAELVASSEFDESAHPRVPAGEPGGGQFGTGSGPGAQSDDSRLAAESKIGVAAIERLLPTALEHADFSNTGTTVTTWNDASGSQQSAAHAAFLEAATDDGIDVDTSALDKETIDDLRSNNEHTVDKTTDDVLAELAQQFPDETPRLPLDDSEPVPVYRTVDRESLISGDDTGDGSRLEYNQSSAVNSGAGFTLNPLAMINSGRDPGPQKNDDGSVPNTAIRFTDGTALTDDEAKSVSDAWDRHYEQNFETDREAAFESDAYYEARNKLESDAIDSNWQDLSSSEKLSYLPDNEAKDLEPSLPGVWRASTDDPGSTEDYMRTGAIGRELVTQRTAELLTQRNQADPALVDPTQAKLNTGYNLNKAAGMHAIWDDWKDSSTSAGGRALQLATAREMGGVHRFTPDEEQAIEDDYGAQNIRDLQSYVRAQWETTQFISSRAGDDNYTVYRGLSLPTSDIEKAKQEQNGGYTRLPDTPLLRNGAASATLDSSVANRWNGVFNGIRPEGLERVVLRASVPRTSVLSLPVFGLNVEKEKEIVLAGTRTKWQWDLWRGAAPSPKTIGLGG